MANKIYRLLILGAPGSGKGTVSSRIVENFNIVHISSGDRLRTNILNKTVLGLEAEKYIQQGKLVPDSYMAKFIINEIKSVGNQNWLLDGFPRTVSQAKDLLECQSIDFVIDLCVPFKIIIDRIKNRWLHIPSGRVYNIDFNAPKVAGRDDVTGEQLSQRSDDKEEVVQKRLDEYDKETRPVIEFYRNAGNLHEFKGNTTNEIWPNILEFLVQNGLPKKAI